MGHRQPALGTKHVDAENVSVCFPSVAAPDDKHASKFSEHVVLSSS